MRPTPERMRLAGALGLLLLLDAAVWLAEKKGVSLTGDGGWNFVRGVLCQPLIWLAVAAGPLQLWLWTWILGRSDLSLAYPITSLAYPLTMGCAWVFLGEHIPAQLWAGALLITAGVVAIGSHVGESPATGQERES